ncbi:MAG: MBL fold metallo-hydrolase [Cytophagaceae bacterium]|nr:MBL fold metallo-hydrolase [Cytophagaceae bacterium]
MIRFQTFVFNAFAENTFVLWDDTLEAVIIDPGCATQSERDTLKKFIETQKLKIIGLLNTHAHVDHVLGNAFVSRTYHVGLRLHEADLPVLRTAKMLAPNYGIRDYEEILPESYLVGGERVYFGESELEVLLVPGHAPGHVAFVNRDQNLCFSGDVLFRGSIGRTDFPGCSHEALMNSIYTQLLPLGDAMRIFPGHGPETTIGTERRSNPFLLQGFR